MGSLGARPRSGHFEAGGRRMDGGVKNLQRAGKIKEHAILTGSRRAGGFFFEPTTHCSAPFVSPPSTFLRQRVHKGEGTEGAVSDPWTPGTRTNTHTYTVVSKSRRLRIRNKWAESV